MVSRIPLVLLACGSFNPITHQHMRLFELARGHMHQTGQYEVVGGIVSPVSDSYGKQGLALAKHRVTMAQLALRTSDWVTVDDWESQQPDWTETVMAMRYHYARIAAKYQKLECQSSPTSCAPQLKFLCGADFLDTFRVPGLWQNDHVEELVGRFGLVCISRGNLQPERLLHLSDLLFKHRQNIFLVHEWIRNEISSTEVRRALRRGLSVKYLLPDSVIEYIKEHNLYTTDSELKNKDVDLRPLTKQALSDC
ncbi:LOW QUALITY PROTEIN: nicotinamide/nicotinic acid mononucleotide adenylyltransferase 3-like [Denticeps clupeoides]|uniref:LOW QUALITY PROTEIN: nicotinamide/nicotinic acid mononucleotide adenylyltransferase 3-like n=1 Tax=Denticeps clupeoides TaxID=299321 RepID=UPI0010A40B0A|nr:LOW QUALITY PROTEIN: nicotinamide/nicotinic acid mononucleotide adenylyltransferase 3-like [Denticeps clupeoides]